MPNILSPLNTILDRYRKAIEVELRNLLTSTGPPYDEYYGMMQYHMGWLDAEMHPAQSQTGKRIRPVLCLLVCEAVGGTLEQALPAAAGLETLHNFSLLHDDIEDTSETRRGRPTAWKLWGEPQAINAGDGMFALAHLAFARLPANSVSAERILAALKIFDQTCLELTRGQYLDMRFEEQLDVAVGDYMTMVGGKTAALIAASTSLGALLGGADETTVGHYHNFGYHLGIAFQIQDDILGIWGDETVTGKSNSIDIETCKKTLPVVYGLEQSPELRQMYTKKQIAPKQVTKVTQILEALDARQMAERMAAEHHLKSTAALEQAGAAGEVGEALNKLAASLLNRIR